MPELLASPPRARTERAPTGVTAAELARRARLPYRSPTLDPDALARWLLRAGFAQQRSELLWPTPLAVEIAGALG